MIKIITESKDDKRIMAHLEVQKIIQKIEDSSYEWKEGHSIKYGKYKVRKKYIGGLTQAEIAKGNKLVEEARKRTTW